MDPYQSYEALEKRVIEQGLPDIIICSILAAQLARYIINGGYNEVVGITRFIGFMESDKVLAKTRKGVAFDEKR